MNLLWIHCLEINYQSTSPAPVDQMNRINIKIMEMWHKRETKLYSTTSKRNQIIVNPIRIAADIVLSLHSRISATVEILKGEIKINLVEIVCNNIWWKSFYRKSVFLPEIYFSVIDWWVNVLKKTKKIKKINHNISKSKIVLMNYFLSTN